MPSRTLLSVLALSSSAAAFTPVPSSAARLSVCVASDAGDATPEVVPEAPAPAPAPVVMKINGWAADATQPCFGLPGAIAPLGFFDPLGFTNEKSLSEVKRIREAEVMHGRIAMMATVGYLVQENTPTISYGFNHPTIANNQLGETAGTVAFSLFIFINFCEAWRANVGWVPPGLGPLFSIRETYYPGDIGFDPAGLKPATSKDFDNMQTKELSNGRLAMLAVAGMCVQELVNGKAIFENLGF